MGYESKVVLNIRHDLVDELRAACRADDGLRRLVAGAEKLVVERGSGDVLIDFGWCKWRDSFADVRELNRFLGGVEDTEKYRLTRMGEDPGDLETEGDFEDRNMCPYVKRELIYDFDARDEVGDAEVFLQSSLALMRDSVK